MLSTDDSNIDFSSTCITKLFSTEVMQTCYEANITAILNQTQQQRYFRQNMITEYWFVHTHRCMRINKFRKVPHRQP